MGKIGLFGYAGEQLYDGLRLGLQRQGHTVAEQVISCFSPAQPLRGIDGVLICGEAGLGRDCADFYRGRGVVSAVVAPGVLDASGLAPQFRIGDRVAEEPDFARLERFRLGKIEPRERTEGYVLMLGQCSGASEHGMSRAVYERWARGMADRIRSVDASEIVWRPHPGEFFNLAGTDRLSDPRTENLHQALEGAWLVVTYNAAASIQALLSGLPVVAEGPSSFAALTGSLGDLKSVRAPSADDLRHYFGRLAASQFTLSELADGWPLEGIFEPSEGHKLFLSADPTKPAPAVPSKDGLTAENAHGREDFTEIERVGPATAAKLYSAGIYSFEDLAGAESTLIASLGLSAPALSAIRNWRGEQADSGEIADELHG